MSDFVIIWAVAIGCFISGCVAGRNSVKEQLKQNPPIQTSCERPFPEQK